MRSGAGSRRRTGRAFLQRQPEDLREVPMSLGRDPQGAAVPLPFDPAMVQTLAAQGGPEGAREMGAALRPIQAGLAEDALGGALTVEGQPDGGEKRLAGRRHLAP